MNFINDIQQAVSHLKKGNTILYPTDTIWGIGCDATNEVAIEKIVELKQRPKEKNLIVLVDSIEMLKHYVDIPPETEKLVLSFDQPVTVIYSAPKNLPKAIISPVNTMAIRITRHEFCRELIKTFGKPIISTSANLSGEKNPVFFEDISQTIKDKVDLIVPAIYDTSDHKQPSRLIRINPDHSIEYLR